MLALRDYIDLCDLTEAEIRAIAEHEHIPEIVAMEHGQYLMQAPDGEPCAIIRDDILEAERHRDAERVLKLKLVLKHFIDSHG
ncbi:MAG: hypothetical protein VW338_11320 [Rhodospirillaceae bacterium]